MGGNGQDHRALSADPVDSLVPFNPKGCFDWWGLSEALPRNAEFARKTGYQISAVKAMLDRLAQNYVASAGSDPFGTPQEFKGPDSTATSVALIWQGHRRRRGVQCLSIGQRD